MWEARIIGGLMIALAVWITTWTNIALTNLPTSGMDRFAFALYCAGLLAPGLYVLLWTAPWQRETKLRLSWLIGVSASLYWLVFLATLLLVAAGSSSD